MLYWAMVFLVIALIAALFGFGRVAAASAGIAKVLRPAVDVSPHEVFIVTRKLGRRRDAPGQHAGPESRSEPLDLPLDPLAHVNRRSIRSMAIPPCGVPSLRGPRGIEQARLHEDHEGSIRNLPSPCGCFRGGHLLERPAEVHGGGLGAAGGLPVDGAI